MYPGALPPAGSAVSTDTLAAAGHTALHNSHSNEVRAVATKIGTGSSTPTASTVLRGTGAGTSAWGQVDLTTDVTSTLPVDKGGTGVTTADELRDQILGYVYPVGSIYVNATNSTNPGTLLGFGTWVAFGQGRVMVGFDSGQTEFDAAEETGGAKTHTLTTAEMPAHTHNSNISVGTAGSYGLTDSATASGSGTWTTGSTGGGDAHNNLQPYITCYFFKRTA